MNALFETLFAHFWKLVLLTAAVFGVVAFLVTREPPVYTADALILLKVGHEFGYTPIDAESATKTPNPGDFQTAVNAEMLMLDDGKLREETLEQFGVENAYPELEGVPDALYYGTAILGANTSVSLITGSYVIRVAVTNTDPVVAADLTNALVDRYLERRRELLMSPDTAALREQLAFSEAQSAKTEKDMETLLKGADGAVYEAEYTALVSQRVDMMTEMAKIDADGVGLQQRIRSLTAARAATDATLVDQTNVAANPVVVDLKARVLSLQAERESKAGMLGPGHPTVRAMDEELAALQRQIDSEAAEVVVQRQEVSNPALSQIDRDLLDASIALEEQAARRGYLQQQIAARDAEIKERATVIASLGLMRKKLDLQDDRVASLDGRLRESEGLERVDSASQGTARVIQTATPPDVQSGAPTKVRLAIAAVLAAAVGGVALVAIHALSSALGTADAVRAQLKLPVLGEVRRRRRSELRDAAS